MLVPERAVLIAPDGASQARHARRCERLCEQFHEPSRLLLLSTLTLCGHALALSRRSGALLVEHGAALEELRFVDQLALVSIERSRAALVYFGDLLVEVAELCRDALHLLFVRFDGDANVGSDTLGVVEHLEHGGFDPLLKLVRLPAPSNVGVPLARAEATPAVAVIALPVAASPLAGPRVLAQVRLEAVGTITAPAPQQRAQECLVARFRAVMVELASGLRLSRPLP